MPAFREGVSLLRRYPHLGSAWPTPATPELRRFFLTAHQTFIYYRVTPTELTVLLVWSALRGPPPNI